MEQTGTSGLVETAKRVLPGGTFGNFPGEVVIREGRGGRVWDEDGKEYVDFLLGSGPMLVGHAHPDVTEAAQARDRPGARRFSPTTAGASNWPRQSSRRCRAPSRCVLCRADRRPTFMRCAPPAPSPARQDPQIRGRLSRHERLFADEPRPKAARQFPAVRYRIRPASRRACATRSWSRRSTISTVSPSLVREHRDELAGVIVEPFQRIIPPQPGFLAGVAQITADNGIPLIFDEVVTGFRLAYGGAQEYYGVVPDLCTLGKVIGGGFPLAAIAGRAEIMAHFDRARLATTVF